MLEPRVPEKAHRVSESEAWDKKAVEESQDLDGDESERDAEAALRRELNAIKRAEYPWMLHAPKAVPQQAIKHAQHA